MWPRTKRRSHSTPNAPNTATGVLNKTLKPLAYQNLESVELGVTSIDHYFDSLGGISRAVRRARGGQAAPVYISDQTRGDGRFAVIGDYENT